MKQSFQKLAAAIIYADGDVAASELNKRFDPCLQEVR